MTTTALVQRQDEWAGARPSHASLSVCCLTGGRYLPRVAGILGLLRPLADEIVVGVDNRARDSAALLGDVADRILLFAHAEPADRPIPWLVRQCKGDWVFNIDDDEVPSAALLHELPGVIDRGDVTHCWVARRWLYPDVSAFLDEPPWNTEYQLRLFKADDRSLRFTDEFHRPVVCSGPARFVEAPLWHLDTALASREERQQKALRYERSRRGMRIGAFSHNTGLYLPELRPEPAVAGVPPRELARIKEVLLTPARRCDGVTIEEPSRDAVEREWPGPPHRPTLYDASIALLRSLPPLVGGVQQTIDLRIQNRGDCVWRTGESIMLATRWNDVESIRTALPADVLPGDSAVVPLHVVPPTVAGAHLLEIDLVHEHVRWFDRSLRLVVDVRGRRRVLVAGRADRLAPVLDAIALTPELEPVTVHERDDPHLGHPHVEGIGRFLFGPKGTAGWRALPRALQLVARARLEGAPRGVRPLAEALRGSELVILVDDDRVVGAPPTRDRARVLVLVATARVQRVPVLRLGSAELPDSRVDRLLHRLVGALTETADDSALAGAFGPLVADKT